MHPLLHRHRQRLSLPDDLQALFVGETGLSWSFSPTEQRYYSFRAGVINSRIRGASLPDPDELHRDRLAKMGLTKDDPAANNYKPTLDTYKLWQDWKGRE